MPLTRLDMVDEDVLLGLAGPDVRVFPVPGAVVALGASGTAIVADAGDDAAVSGVWNEEEFRLIGPAPEPVRARLMGPMPFTTHLADDPELPIHLAVRVDGRCLYLGVVQVGGCEGAEDELTSCDLWIDPSLSRETLAVVRPPGAMPILPGLEWLEGIGRDPQHALEMFVTGWYPETDTVPSVRTVPDFVPPALADFYRLAEKRPAILGEQNFIEPLAALAPGGREGRLRFADENQGGWDWSVSWEPDAASTDPAVLLTSGDVSTPEQEPLSRFLLQFSLHEAAITAPYQAAARGLPGQLLPVLESFLQRVPLRPFMSPVVAKNFLVAPGVVAQVSPSYRNESEVTVQIGACHRGALQPLSELGLEWRRFDG
ncbi:hypothetical protein OG455_03095 [Kitasatospora sp. NBC_01287]|uniref:hypothetical protein n=1 Tax=Kitasatospora sp. NBC_01287 TaxID=2903573 RepID=UPI00225BE225|nr:hypothetical protein [Kitasatospora sp. NBC_01287]MCX4744514.1 hypothetical protein [Kitasatospora sp. NBC_01287]